MRMMITNDSPIAIALHAGDIADLPFEPFSGTTSFRQRMVWRDGEATAEILAVDAGQRLGSHTHRTHHHHLWVIDGEVDVIGTRLCAGSYTHISAGVEHDLDASATYGCTVFYVYERSLL